jgi:hypothetical protein
MLIYKYEGNNNIQEDKMIILLCKNPNNYELRICSIRPNYHTKLFHSNLFRNPKINAVSTAYLVV